MFKRKSLPNDLNIQTHHRVSGLIVLVISILLSLILFFSIFKVSQYIHLGDSKLSNSFLVLILSSLVLILVSNVILLNHKFYFFLFKCKGFLFMLKSIPLHFFYYLYSTVTFSVFVMDYYVPLFRKVREMDWILLLTFNLYT